MQFTKIEYSKINEDGNEMPLISGKIFLDADNTHF